MLMEAEGFADEPPEPIAFHASAGRAHGDGQSETRATLVIPERNHTKESVAEPTPTCVGCLEICLAA